MGLGASFPDRRRRASCADCDLVRALRARRRGAGRRARRSDRPFGLAVAPRLPAPRIRRMPSWAPDVVGLFTELAAIPSPPGSEREVADRVRAYLEDLGLEVSEDDAGARIDANAKPPSARADERERRRAHLPLRSPRHGSADRTARAGGRGRRRAQRGRDDPRGRQQGSRRRDARGHPADPLREPPACRHRAPVHTERGGGPPGPRHSTPTGS